MALEVMMFEPKSAVGKMQKGNGKRPKYGLISRGSLYPSY